MPIDLLDIFNILSNSCKIRVTPDKTRRIKELIQGLDDPEQTTACIRIFLSHYPEESLLEFCFQRFFENVRPLQLDGPKYNIWKRELVRLVQALKNLRVPKWDATLYHKAMTYCPQLAAEIWKNSVPTS